MIKTIILIGPPGSGKSSCGRVLADRLGWSFVDTDRLIEDQAGMTVPEIFERLGERFFRSLEREFLNGLVGGTLGLKLDGLVIGTGGGLPISPGNFELLCKLGEVICLHASVKELVTRLSADTGRPLLAVTAGPEPIAEDRAQALTDRLEMILRDRWQHYQRAQYQFDTSGRTTEEVADEIVKLLNISA